MKILGIDEAGRGPVIGSLYMCGYLINEKKIRKLKEMGVKDSKLLSKEKGPCHRARIAGIVWKGGPSLS